MKKFIIVMILVLFTLTACTQGLEVEPNLETTEADVISEDVELLPREEVLLKFFSKMYNITDNSEYEIYIENFQKYLMEENITELNFGYDEMCTEDGLNSVVSNRWHSFYREAALAGEFTMSMNNVDYSQTFDEKADATILKKYRTVGYEFAVELQIEYSDGEIENIVEEGFVNLKNIDGEWKIDLFQLKDLKEFWLNFTMPG
ncbi:MAG: hypothetical protein K8R73_01245 [Clostridiales bacterium]|nr:hypothetical protein [Clostridiales bacterium]